VMGWAGYVARIGAERNARTTTFWFANIKGREHMGD
jgi:hypothetical protein